MSKDTLHRYLFDDADVRGELVQLENSYQDVINAHPYPAPLRNILGQLMAATSLLTATLKFRGDISIQLQGDGPVSLAVINGNNEQQLRGVARWQGELADDSDLPTLFGKGHMVITLTPEQGERYQGVVTLDKSNLGACVEDYFMQSEQLATSIWLFADEKQAAGMLLQVLPSEKDHSDDFDHLVQLTSTIKQQELFELDVEQVLHRLYHQETVHLYDPVAVSFKCSCSKERSAQAIRSVSKEEIDSIIAEVGHVEMGCEYCNSHYKFDAIDVEAIFAISPTHTTSQ